MAKAVSDFCVVVVVPVMPGTPTIGKLWWKYIENLAGFTSRITQDTDK
jgi:hypothetical protein